MSLEISSLYLTHQKRPQIQKIISNDVISLLEEHRNEMFNYSPPESIHALTVDELQGPEMTFWSLWSNNQLAGCGGLKELSSTHGEIKSMRTSKAFLRKGVAQEILIAILKEAKNRGYTQLSLETGSMSAFMPARKLYEKYGFEYCKPFAAYKEDPNSIFMTKLIT